MKKLTFILIWILATPIFFSSVVTYSYHRKTQPKILGLNIKTQAARDSTMSSSGPIISDVKGISTDVETADARPVIISEFLEKNESPLTPYDYYGKFLTNLADKYNLDFRLLPSIMMQESNLCKKIPESSYNCLGLGIHSRGTWEFSRFEDNFEVAAKILREKYLDKGYITPDEIQDKYTPGSNGSWEFAVNHFMDVLETAEFIE